MKVDDRIIAPPGAQDTRPRVGAGALAGIALLTATAAIHITELSGKVAETAYLGLGYLLLVAACIVAIVLIAQDDPRGWTIGVLACAATLFGFVLTRTTGLPGATGDIGNWTETIAVWSLVVEGLFVVLGVARRPSISVA